MKRIVRLAYMLRSAFVSIRLSAPLSSIVSVLAVSALLLLTSLQQAHTQPVAGEGPRWYGTTGKNLPYDTTALKEAQERTLKSAGLLERPIDPDKYLLGPNDILSVTIWTQQTRQFQVIVTPDVKIQIPTVGEVNVRGLTLTAAAERIRQAVAKEYKVESSLSLSQMRQFKVNVIGAVHEPGAVIATPATKVSEVIDLAGGALQKADKRNILLFRTSLNGSNQQIIPVDLLRYYVEGDVSVNPQLQDGDVVRVNIVDPASIIQVYGEVSAPGEYPWRNGDSISTMIRAAFGTTVRADLDSIEVVTVDDHGDFASDTWHQLLPNGSVTDDRELEIGDRIFIRPKPKYRELSQIVVEGEVQRPGVFPIKPGITRLRTVIEAAGGFSPGASIADAALIRRQAVGQDDEYFAYVNAIESERRTPEESEYFRTKLLENRRQGNMTIDFPGLMEGDDSQNLLLIDQDSLYVPPLINYIRISGKVKNPGNFLYVPNFSYQNYIARAGGYGWKADKGETQIIKARTGDRLPAEDESEYILEPGDAIFVPEEKPGNFWEGFTTSITIVAQVATIIAVVVSLIPSKSSN